MTRELTRVRVWSTARMVTLQADLVHHEGEPVLLEGGADGLHGNVCCVSLDDGRELLIARKDLEVT